SFLFFFLALTLTPTSTLFPYTTLFRSEDVKEYWWYLDSTPTHSWMTWRYHYPQRPFPYGDLVAGNARRGVTEREYELVDTGVFRSEEHTSELQSRSDLVCRLLLEKKKN